MNLTGSPERATEPQIPPEGDRTHRSLGMTIAKNTLVVMMGSAVLKALNFLFNVYVIRRLGDDRFGQYSVVLAFVGLYQIFAELGISQYVMRESAKDRTKAEYYFWNLVAVRLLLALSAVVLMPLLAYRLGYSQQLILGVFLFACSFLLAAVAAPLQGLLTAYERFDIVTAMNVLGQVVFVLFGAAFLLSGLGYIWLIVASLIGLVPQIALGLWAVQRSHILAMQVRFHPAIWPSLVRSGLPFGIISLSLSIAFRLDTVILKGYQPDHVVGWYNAAYNLVFSLMFLVSGFKDAIVPSLTRTYVTEPQEVDRWYYRTVKIMMILSVPIAVGGTLVAYPLIRLLYTDAFLPSAIALQILIWDVPFLMFIAFCGNITTIVNLERQAARIYTIDAIANVLLNLYAIPRYGLIGAAVITVVTDLIGTLQFNTMLSRKLHQPNMVPLMLKIVAASLVMGLAVWLSRGLQVLLSIAIGVAAFTVMALFLRLLDESEWAFMRRLVALMRKPGPVA